MLISVNQRFSRSEKIMKIIIPHIHKIEGEAGFWASVAETGKIEELKINVLEGLRQIEGILVGRRIQDIPIVVSRIHYRPLEYHP